MEKLQDADFIKLGALKSASALPSSAGNASTPPAHIFRGGDAFAAKTERKLRATKAHGLGSESSAGEGGSASKTAISIESGSDTDDESALRARFYRKGFKPTLMLVNSGLWDILYEPHKLYEDRVRRLARGK